VAFNREYDDILRLARENGSFDDHADELVAAWAGLQTLRHQALRTLSSDAAASSGVEANVNKLLWAPWHKQLGELAMKVAGTSALEVSSDGLSPLQNLFLFTRSDTIYGGSNEIQRNVIAERHWMLPRDTWSAT
jgi:alkylation response protein AidB-like acyl-CoA dehydrogenase